MQKRHFMRLIIDTCLLNAGEAMKRKKKKQDHITTWLQRSYYLIVITKELDLVAWIKATITKFIDS